MTSLNRQDRELHYPDGTHISTASSANGAALARYERRIKAHLQAHETQSELKEDVKPVRGTT